jgi:hypothetical protein
LSWSINLIQQKYFLQKKTNTGRGGGDAGWKRDQFDGSMREAGRRMNITNTVSTTRKENDIGEEEIPQRTRNVDRGDLEREDGYRKRDGDREDRGRDDVQRRRDGDREDRGRDRKESNRRVRRDDYREGSYDRKGPRDDGGGRREDRSEDRRNDRRGRGDERDRNRDVSKERERSA